MAEPVLEARGIVKSFGRVQALRGANFTVYPSEVVALVGDNGAGKSTLVKIARRRASARQRRDPASRASRSRIDTPQRRPRRSASRPSTRISRWPPEIDPAANMFLGREILRGRPARQARLPRQGRDAPRSRRGVPQPRRRHPGHRGAGGQPVRRPAPGRRDRRAVTWASRSSSWTSRPPRSASCRRATCSSLIRRVRDTGISVVLISHNMPEVFEVADRIEVLRLGQRVARLKPSEVSMEDVVVGA